MNEGTVFEALMSDKVIDDVSEQQFRAGYMAGLAKIETKYWDSQRLIDQYAVENKALKETLSKAIGTINEFACGFCMCCKNHDNEKGCCTLENGCKDQDNWEWVLSEETVELIQE